MLLLVRFGARAVKPRVVAQQRIKQAAELDEEIPVVKEHDPKERLNPNQIDEAGLAQVRLNDQHLPPTYIKRAQQVFSKYDQQQLREIAGSFSQLMNLMYKEDKVDYSKVQPFTRLKTQLPKDKQVEKIVLVGKNRPLTSEEGQNAAPKEQEDPIGVKQGYNQNTVLSYLLKRVPRTFATAVRIFTEIRFKYPGFRPASMIDFGSGLSSGSYAFKDVFQLNNKQIYNIEPNTTMFKLSRFLSQDTDIQHFKALGELSRVVAEVDLVYVGYVLNEIESQNIPIYVEALWTKVKPGGFLVIAEYGNPYGSRLIHDLRKWAIDKKIHVAAPCTHQMACPMAGGKRWCHFDQPAGSFPRKIFGRLPTDHAVSLQKFAYLVLEKPGDSSNQSILSSSANHWDRVIFPTMKRGGHVIIDLCTTEGKLQRKIVAKSHGEEFKEARKLRWGDLWRFGRRIPNKFRKESRRGKRLW